MRDLRVVQHGRMIGLKGLRSTPITVVVTRYEYDRVSKARKDIPKEVIKEGLGHRDRRKRLDLGRKVTHGGQCAYRTEAHESSLTFVYDVIQALFNALSMHCV